MISDLAMEISQRSGEQVELCYHCHKCAAGCPVLSSMTYGPDRILRMAALGQTRDVLQSSDIWLCAGCFACATRCPNGIDIAAVMDALRQAAIAEGVPAGVPDAYLFHRLFLGVVRRLGRSHEAAMLGLFKVLSHVPIVQDMDAGIRLFLRGKVPLIPRGGRSAGEVHRIFERSE
jgi:heterodisulfide reductase subunit C